MHGSSRDALRFVGPRDVASVAAPGSGELLVETVVSAISPGTELLVYRGEAPSGVALLVYRGEAPSGVALDTSIDGMRSAARFPLKYGYATVGRVVALGPGVDEGWRGRLAFRLHPHESRFLARADELYPVPEGLAAEHAALYPSVETAMTLVMDGRPMIGERAAPVALGGAFHRSRMRLISSQVSTIDPALSGRWSKQRRRDAAWDLLTLIAPAQLVTHRFRFAAAPDAYALLDRHPEEAVQVLLTYDA